MGIQERKEREKEQRRQSIVEAAETVFFSKGFEKATMDDVAEEAELSKGTLYLYFNSKEDLYAVIIKKGITILHQLFAEAVAKEETGLSKVRAIGEAFVIFSTEYPDYSEAMLYGHSRLHPEDVEALEDCQKHDNNEQSEQIFISSITQGIDDGSIRKNLDPAKTAILLWGELLGVLQLAHIKRSMLKKVCGVEPEGLLEYFFEFTYVALKA